MAIQIAEQVVEDYSALMAQMKTMQIQLAALQMAISIQNNEQEVSHQNQITLNVKEVAKLWKLSESRIYVLTGLKLIPSHRIGSRIVFYRDEIMKLIDSGFRVTMQDEINARKRMQEIRGVGIVGRKKAEAL